MLIIAVTGLRGAGKSLVKEVGEEFGIPSLEMSDAVLDAMERIGVKRDGEMGSVDIRDFAKMMRERFGPDVFARKTIEKLLEQGYQTVIVSGVRGMYEIETFRKHGRVVIIAVVADKQLRFKRTVARNRQHDPKTYEEFILADEKDKGFGVDEVIENADYVIENNGTIAEAKEKVRSVLRTIVRGGSHL